MTRTYRISYTKLDSRGVVFFDAASEQAARDRFKREHPGATITEVKVVNAITAFMGLP